MLTSSMWSTVALFCIVVVGGGRVGNVHSLELPAPVLDNNNSNGGLEISIEAVPGVQYKYIKYTVDQEVFVGPFQQGDDGLWIHRNPSVAHHQGALDYVIVADHEGKEITVEGTVGHVSHKALALPGRLRRAGHTVLRDDFGGSGVNHANWKTEVSAYGGFNGEFQVYTNDHANLFARDGHLYIKPTLTKDKLGDNFMHSGNMDVRQLWGTCTQEGNGGCNRQGIHIPPIMSGKLKSNAVIRFGHVEVRAKTPCGDWIWPALWMMPRSSAYGNWPASGEIDVMESRGNAVAGSNPNHGNVRVTSTLHWGPDSGHDRFSQTHGGSQGSFCTAFHTYTLDWTVDHIVVAVDGHTYLHVSTPPQGFWSKGGFHGTNIWSHGTKAAPFDHSFYFIMNVAVGGTVGFFPDSMHYNSHKPWNNHSPTAKKDFWDGRNNWLPSWHGDDVAMQVDYIEMQQY